MKSKFTPKNCNASMGDPCEAQGPHCGLLAGLIFLFAIGSTCVAQGPSSRSPQESSRPTEFEILQGERKRFQQQELLPAKRNNWIIKPGEPPRIVWRDVEEVRRLGVKHPLTVRWFNSDFEEVDIPQDPGRWCAWVQGVAPNGTPMRRTLTFYLPPAKVPFYFAPEITVALPPLPQTTLADVWREHEAELSRLSTDLMKRTFADSETSAILFAGLADAKPRGRPARFSESVEVLNEEYHLALKLRVLGLEERVRTLKPPRRRSPPAPKLRAGSARQAGMLPQAKAKIDAICRDWLEDTDEPFVTLVARNGVIVTHEAFGKDPSGKPIELDYRCWVGSITKSVTALLFSQFLDQQLIQLDDSLATVFPDFDAHAGRTPTFRQCFNHTSGLTGHGEFGGFRHPHLENIILNAIDVNEPNARYAYSGMGYEAAVKAMEIVSGKSGVRLYDEHLFQPLEFGDVPIGNASSDGHFTALELGVLAQWVANRGSYGNLEFITADTFASLLPRPVLAPAAGDVREHGIGLHWARKLRPGAPRNSQRPEDQIFSQTTVGHGSFSGCIFMIDLEQNLVIAQARRRTGPRWGEWSTELFQCIASCVDDGA